MHESMQGNSNRSHTRDKTSTKENTLQTQLKIYIKSGEVISKREIREDKPIG